MFLLFSLFFFLPCVWFGVKLSDLMHLLNFFRSLSLCLCVCVKISLALSLLVLVYIFLSVCNHLFLLLRIIAYVCVCVAFMMVVLSGGLELVLPSVLHLVAQYYLTMLGFASRCRKNGGGNSMQVYPSLLVTPSNHLLTPYSTFPNLPRLPLTLPNTL